MNLFRYEVRAVDDHGDLGTLAGRYFWRWRAHRHCRRAEKERHRVRAERGWREDWHYYVLDHREPPRHARWTPTVRT